MTDEANATRKMADGNVAIPLGPDDRYPGEDQEGEFLYSNPDSCRGCGGMILPENRRLADGCPCNSPRGVNHGLVPKNTCTCVACDPEQTGSTRYLDSDIVAESVMGMPFQARLCLAEDAPLTGPELAAKEPPR